MTGKSDVPGARVVEDRKKGKRLKRLTIVGLLLRDELAAVAQSYGIRKGNHEGQEA